MYTTIFRHSSIVPGVLAPLEESILDFTIQWGDVLYKVSPMEEEAWNSIMGEMFCNSALVKRSIMALLAMSMLSAHNIRYLVDEIPRDDYSPASLALVHRYSMVSYHSQITQINALMSKLVQGNCTPDEAIALCVGSMLLFTVVVSHPQRQFPFVHFETRKNDFISYCQGFKQMVLQCMPLLPKPLFALFVVPNHIPSPVLPLFQRLLEQVNNPQVYIGDHRITSILHDTISIMNQHTYYCSEYRSYVYLYQISTCISDSFWDLVYGRNPLALSIVNVYAGLCVLIQYCFDRNMNIWIEYMDWYRDGHQMYVWDEPLYSMVVTKRYEVGDYSEMATFDPVVLDSVL